MLKNVTYKQAKIKKEKCGNMDEGRRKTGATVCKGGEIGNGGA